MRPSRYLVPLCMEMDTPAGPVDAVYATPTGRLALLEVKLSAEPGGPAESHRSDSGLCDPDF